MKSKALAILGSYAFNNRTNKEISARIDLTIRYLNDNINKKVVCKKNNNWSKSPSGLINPIRIGGVTYKYQLWLGIEK